MELIRLSPSELRGELNIPPSKSLLHRAIICAMLAEGETQITPLSMSHDIIATLEACRMLGAVADVSEDGFTVSGTGAGTGAADGNPVRIDCRESASTLRFLLPVTAALGINAVFDGADRLKRRPVSLYKGLFEAHGVSCSSDALPLGISGRLTGGSYVLPGDVSSQFVSGLLLALPLCRGESEILLSTPLCSAPYVELTLKVLHDFGIAVEKTQSGFRIAGNQRYVSPGKYTAEGDWSQATFYLAAAAINSDITIKGLNLNSSQGDKAALEILRDAGMTAVESDGLLSCRRGTLKPFDADISDIPDAAPALAVTAAYAYGKSRFFGAERLRLKESDRAAAVCEGLARMGARAELDDDILTVYGRGVLRGERVSGHNDHRIVMAFAVAALAAVRTTHISGFSAVWKSYPEFFADYNALGGKSVVVGFREQNKALYLR